jgi:hypothetical protein
MVLSGEFTLVHDLRNVPAGIDENTLLEVLTKSTNDKRFLNALVKKLEIRDKRIARGGVV